MSDYAALFAEPELQSDPQAEFTSHFNMDDPWMAVRSYSRYVTWPDISYALLSTQFILLTPISPPQRHPRTHQTPNGAVTRPRLHRLIRHIEP